jgi:hypothetical protein
LRTSQPKAYRPGSPVVQFRVPKDTLARIDELRGEATRSAWVSGLIDRELAGQMTTPAPASAPLTAAAAPLTAIGTGEPSPGVACAGPGCWQRNTSRYGLRRVPLCPACRAALEGRTYQREVPETAARAIRRGAA